MYNNFVLFSTLNLKSKFSFNTLDLSYKTSQSLLDFTVPEGTGSNVGVARGEDRVGFRVKGGGMWVWRRGRHPPPRVWMFEREWRITSLL